MTGPTYGSSCCVTKGTRCRSVGCSRFQRSASCPSRASSLKLGQLQMLAATPQSFSSSSLAAMLSRRIVPLPSTVADVLEADHRGGDIERYHDAVVRRVRRRRGDARTHATRLVDAFLQDLAALVFLVVHDLVLVDRRVLLALGVVDADLAEQALHAEGARLVDGERHRARAGLLCSSSLREGSSAS